MLELVSPCALSVSGDSEASKARPGEADRRRPDDDSLLPMFIFAAFLYLNINNILLMKRTLKAPKSGMRVTTRSGGRAALPKKRPRYEESSYSEDEQEDLKDDDFDEGEEDYGSEYQVDHISYKGGAPAQAGGITSSNEDFSI
jgi:hypothetical protein